MTSKIEYPKWLVCVVDICNKFRTIDYGSSHNSHARAQAGFEAFCKDLDTKQIILAVKHNYLVRKVVDYKNKKITINAAD